MVFKNNNIIIKLTFNKEKAIRLIDIKNVNNNIIKNCFIIYLYFF